MKVKILGAAAGGGFPQWNCACRNCASLRAGTFHGKARTQAQIAISSDGDSWFLLGASPDLRAQIEASPELCPRNGLRQSPVAGVVLSSGDVDQVLGLLLLRELQPLRIYATASIRRILCEDNQMFAMLNRIPGQAIWTDIVLGEQFSLISPGGKSSELRCEAVCLPSRFPAYIQKQRAAQFAPDEALLATIIEDRSGHRLAYLPAVPEINDALLEQLRSIDLLLFDGTFWSDDELLQIQGKGQSARQMGHTPLSSREGSLRKLSGLVHPRKIYVHINNTNPILDESSPQYQEVQAAGWEVAEDGWNIRL